MYKVTTYTYYYDSKSIKSYIFNSKKDSKRLL